MGSGLNCSPITPVEETKTWFSLQWKIFDAKDAYSFIDAIPLLPVYAFALPELTIKTLQRFFLFSFLSHITGAEGVEDFVKTAANFLGFSKTITKRSSFDLLYPALKV